MSSRSARDKALSAELRTRYGLSAPDLGRLRKAVGGRPFESVPKGVLQRNARAVQRGYASDAERRRRIAGTTRTFGGATESDRARARRMWRTMRRECQAWSDEHERPRSQLFRDSWDDATVLRYWRAFVNPSTRFVPRSSRGSEYGGDDEPPSYSFMVWYVEDVGWSESEWIAKYGFPADYPMGAAA